MLTAAWAGDRVDLAMPPPHPAHRRRGLGGGRAALTERGLLTAAGGLTAAGRTVRSDVEDATDRASAAPYDRLGPDGTARLWQLAAELSGVLVDAGRIPAVTPVGAPWPPPVPLAGRDAPDR